MELTQSGDVVAITPVSEDCLNRLPAFAIIKKLSGISRDPAILWRGKFS